MSNTVQQSARAMTPDTSQNRILRISIVCYDSNDVLLKNTLASLLVACELPLQQQLLKSVEIVLVDNGPSADEQVRVKSLLYFGNEEAVEGVVLSSCGNGINVGFAAGHNQTFSPDDCGYHLVLNPDVEMAPDALSAALEFMTANSHCGIIAPAVFDRDGKREYLCKRYPTVFDLSLRGFAPCWVRGLYRERLARYEMRDVIGDEVVLNPPIISGCFMLLRSSALRALKGFDASYFLYFEDFDLSLRAAQVCEIAYVPSVKIVHHGGYAAQKGWRHIFMFIRSATRFFSSHGWRWY